MYYLTSLGYDLELIKVSLTKGQTLITHQRYPLSKRTVPNMSTQPRRNDWQKYQSAWYADLRARIKRGEPVLVNPAGNEVAASKLLMQDYKEFKKLSAEAKLEELAKLEANAKAQKYSYPTYLPHEREIAPQLEHKAPHPVEHEEPRIVAMECVVCMAKTKQILFEPCMHIVCCPGCATQVTECPICRRAIKSSKKVFF
jgi:hypothetical protein